MSRFLALLPPTVRIVFPSLLAVTATILSGCAFDTRQSTLDPKGPIAQVQYDLFWVTVWVCLVIFLVVGTALLYAVWRFRERPGDENKPMPPQGHGNPLVEIGLITVSILLLVIIAIPTLSAVWYTHELPVDKPYYETSKLGTWYGGELPREERDQILEINVYGWQWWWSFEYPQFGITTANEMFIPAGHVVKLNLRSMDVIHSFWLPKIAGKVDLIPGRRNWMWIMAGDPFDSWLDKQPEATLGLGDGDQRLAYQQYLQNEIIGHYYGQCAEFCGEAHAYMLFRAEVVDDAAFQDWVEAYQAGAAAPGGFQATPAEPGADPVAQNDWIAWSQAIRSNPEAFAGDPIHQGASLFMGRGQCLVCHAIDNSPAQGQTAPNLTRVGMRKSLGAGILDNRGPDGEIDPELQLENLTAWLERSEHFKPGSLMYYRSDAGLQNLKMNGVTYAGLQSVGIGIDQLVRAGVPRPLAEAFAARPDEAINSISIERPGRGGQPGTSVSITRNQLVRALRGLSLEQLASISAWPTNEEYRDIARFLQTLQ